jgi:hypothetical protein
MGALPCAPRVIFPFLFACIGGLSEIRAGSIFRIGPIEGITESWQDLHTEIELPVGTSVTIELVWGRNGADVNADGAIDLSDFSTISGCFSKPGARRPNGCSPDEYFASDLDSNGSVDIQDVDEFRRAMRHPESFQVNDVSWTGAQEIGFSRESSQARLDIETAGVFQVRAVVELYDGVAKRSVTIDRAVTVRAVSAPSAASRSQWSQPGKASIGNTQRGSTAVTLLVNVFQPDGKDLNDLTPGDVVAYELGVLIDPSYDPPAGMVGSGNRGLASLVYDIDSPQAIVAGQTDPGAYTLAAVVDAQSGFTSNSQGPRVVSSLHYSPNADTVSSYGGGWGFNRTGLPGGGDVTTIPGRIGGAGVAVPLAYVADVQPNFGGLQPNVRLDVGVGTYDFPPDDPVVGGLQGGFGQFLPNAIEGDGTWLFQSGTIDTSGWIRQAYDFDILPTQVQVFDGSLDYTIDHGAGFRLTVPANDIGGAAFSFTLTTIPGDINGDGVVDLEDFAAFANCFGFSVADPPPGCSDQEAERSDLDMDGIVNLMDFASFALSFGNVAP